LSFESFDPENQRIMRELEKESAERGTTWKIFGRGGRLRAKGLRSLVLGFLL
jgi:hypothetical protein